MTAIDTHNLPPIFARVHVTSPVVISGSARVWEASFEVDVRYDNRVLESHTITADKGAPDRGDWKVTLDLAPHSNYILRFFERSQETGEPNHIVDVPIYVGERKT